MIGRGGQEQEEEAADLEKHQTKTWIAGSLSGRAKMNTVGGDAADIKNWTLEKQEL